MVRLAIALLLCVPPWVSCGSPMPTQPSWRKHEGINCAEVDQNNHQRRVINLEHCQELCMHEHRCQGITTVADVGGVFCWLLSGAGAVQGSLDVAKCETNRSGADTYAYLLQIDEDEDELSYDLDEVANDEDVYDSDATDDAVAVFMRSRQLFSLDDISNGLNFAAGIIGDIAGAIGTAVVEAFRLAMRLLRALIIMVKTIVQLICNIVGELMDSAGTMIASLVGGTKSFFEGSLAQITKIVQIGFTTSAMIYDHIVAMTSRLPSVITGALQLDELLEASEAVLAVNPFGRPPYESDANGLMSAAQDLQNVVFTEQRRLSSRRRMSSPLRRVSSPRRRSQRRRAPTVKEQRRRQPLTPRRRAPVVVATPRRRTPVPKKTPKSKYTSMSFRRRTSSSYRKSSYGRKDSGIMRKVMQIVSAYYLYSNACEYYQLSIQGVVAIASIFPGGFEESMARLQVTIGEEAKFEDFVLSKLLSDEVLSCPYTTCTSSLFSTGWDNLKKISNALTGNEDEPQLPTLKAPQEVTDLAAMKVQRKCRAGKQCVPENSKCMPAPTTGDPCTNVTIPTYECEDSSDQCFEVLVRDENEYYVAEVNDTYFSECPREGLKGVECRNISNNVTCFWMDPSPACIEDAEPWCFEPGKYVPAPGCPGSPVFPVARKSAYFPALNLYYSYEACGGRDLFPNPVSNTCTGLSYQTCKSPCVWGGLGMQTPTPLCRNKRPVQSSSQKIQEPKSGCGEYVEECLGMYAVLQHVLSSPKARELLVNYDDCLSAMNQIANSSSDEPEPGPDSDKAANIEQSCQLYVTKEALAKAGYNASTTIYNATYFSNCTDCGQPWAEPAIHECRREAIQSGDAPVWCSQPACFVTAQHPHSAPSSWFPGSGLFYSYRQCGSFDVFSLGRGSCESIGQCKEEDGCEVATNLDDPVCCIDNVSTSTTVSVISSITSSATPLAKLGLFVGTMTSFAILASQMHD